MSTQDDADALLARLKEDEISIHNVAVAATDSAAKVQASLDALAAQVAAGEAIDLTEVQAEAQVLADALAPLADAVAAIGEETPNPPPPPAG